MQITDKQYAMYKEFDRIIAKQKANKEKDPVNEFMGFWSEVFGAEAFQSFADAIIIEFRPHIFGKEVINAKETAWDDLKAIQFVHVDEMLLGVGRNLPPSVPLLKREYHNPPMTVGNNLDELTKYQLSKFKEQQ